MTFNYVCDLQRYEIQQNMYFKVMWDLRMYEIQRDV